MTEAALVALERRYLAQAAHRTGIARTLALLTAAMARAAWDGRYVTWVLDGRAVDGWPDVAEGRWEDFDV